MSESGMSQYGKQLHDACHVHRGTSMWTSVSHSVILHPDSGGFSNDVGVACSITFGAYASTCAVWICSMSLVSVA